MKFGIREICDVVLRAKDDVKIGNQTFKADEPVIYFDSAKTSSVEGAATTVYATGGRGNSRLIAWEGEKTVTFTMEDALLSPLGFSILSGAGLIDASAIDPIYVHTTLKTRATVTSGDQISINLKTAMGDNLKSTQGQEIADKTAYAFIMEKGEIKARLNPATPSSGSGTVVFEGVPEGYEQDDEVTVLVDFYVKASSGAYEMEITPDKFGGYYYLEASTLFRRQDTGKDMAATFIIPKVKIQSNFTFSMASSGDPSTFTFTMDAFPDYTKFDKTKEVLFVLQIIE